MKKILIGLGSILVVLLVIVSVSKAPNVPVSFGGTSPEISSPYIKVGGVSTYFASLALNAATSTPCSIQSPSSTSTLQQAAIQITTGTSTAVTLRVATSTTAFATTTTLNTYALASGAQGSFIQIATTTDKIIIPPNTFVVWGVEGTVISDPTKLLGTCNAEFTVF